MVKKNQLMIGRKLNLGKVPKLGAKVPIGKSPVIGGKVNFKRGFLSDAK